MNPLNIGALIVKRKLEALDWAREFARQSRQGQPFELSRELRGKARRCAKIWRKYCALGNEYSRIFITERGEE